MEYGYNSNKDRERLNKLEKENSRRQMYFGVSLVPLFISWQVLLSAAMGVEEAGESVRDEYGVWYGMVPLVFSAASQFLALNMLPRDDYLELEKKLSK